MQYASPKRLANLSMARPLKHQSLKIFQETIDQYFKDVEAKREIATVTGLAMALEMDRHTLLAYEGNKEFSTSIKKARAKIESVIEQRLLTGKPPIGLIFWLKNNAGWRDENTTRHEGQITHGFVALPPLKAKVIEPISVKNIENPA
jgi:hypothetical protein